MSPTSFLLACVQTLCPNKTGLRASANQYQISCSVIYAFYSVIVNLWQNYTAHIMYISCCIRKSKRSNQIKFFVMPEECLICKDAFKRTKDKYLIQGRSKENLQFELGSLPFAISFNSSKYLCRSCVNVLKRRRGLIEHIHETEACSKSSHERRLFREFLTVYAQGGERG